MKAFKKLCLGTMVISGGLMFMMGTFNSMVINDSAFMNNDFQIKFAKRLDEMNGEVVKGRITASIPKLDRRALKVAMPPKLVSKTQKEEKQESKKEQRETVKELEPEIMADLDMEFDSGMMDEKSAKKGEGYTGSAMTRGGYLEGIKVNLPSGKSFEVVTHGRMNGKIFEFEDSESGELRTGLIYTVNKDLGKYYITFPGDTNLSRLRMGLKAKVEQTQDFGYKDDTQIAKEEDKELKERQDQMARDEKRVRDQRDEEYRNEESLAVRESEEDYREI